MPVDSPGWMPVLVQAYPAVGELPASLTKLIETRGVLVHKHAGDVMFEPVDFSTRYPFVLRGIARVLVDQHDIAVVSIGDIVIVIDALARTTEDRVGADDLLRRSASYAGRRREQSNRTQ